MDIFIGCAVVSISCAILMVCCSLYTIWINRKIKRIVGEYLMQNEACFPEGMSKEEAIKAVKEAAEENNFVVLSEKILESGETIITLQKQVEARVSVLEGKCQVKVYSRKE